MTEIKKHTTIYWAVPEGVDPQSFIDMLKTLTKNEVLQLATDFGDSEFEVNE
jgi:hypothetical protein